MAERLAAGEVGEVDFDDGDGDGGDGVGDGDGGVGVAAGVEDDAVIVAGGGVDAVDEFAFEVGLEVVDGGGGVFDAELAEAVVEGTGAVDGGFPGAQEIEVGAVEYEYSHRVVL